MKQLVHQLYLSANLMEKHYVSDMDRTKYSESTLCLENIVLIEKHNNVEKFIFYSENNC